MIIERKRCALRNTHLSALLPQGSLGDRGESGMKGDKVSRETVLAKQSRFMSKCW